MPGGQTVASGGVENSNENADALISILKKNNVIVLDYRPLLLKEYPDWYSAFYITDHHWKNTTALWAAGEMATVLNEKAGFNFDSSYFSIDSYNIETRDNYFLGSQGRNLTTVVADLESFSEVTPKFNTDLSIYIPSRGIDIRGNYEETLYRKDAYERIQDYGLTDFEVREDAYHSVMWRNDALGNVQNYISEDNDGKRILIIQDSFGWYLSTYLALDVAQIDYMNLCVFTGSLKKYIDESKPDAVVLLISESNIRPLSEEDFESHKHFFDFR